MTPAAPLRALDRRARRTATPRCALAAAAPAGNEAAAREPTAERFAVPTGAVRRGEPQGVEWRWRGAERVEVEHGRVGARVAGGVAVEAVEAGSLPADPVAGPAPTYAVAPGLRVVPAAGLFLVFGTGGFAWRAEAGAGILWLMAAAVGFLLRGARRWPTIEEAGVFDVRMTPWTLGCSVGGR